MSFKVFCRRQDPTSQYSAVIPKFIRIMKNGESPLLFGAEEQSRDFTFVSNVVQANLLACKENMGEFFGEVFNAATGKRVTINELISNINKLLNKDIKGGGLTTLDNGK